MLRIVLVLSAAVLFGCNSTDSGSDPAIPFGTYQEVVQLSDGAITLQLQFKSDGTYAGKNYVTLTNGSINCLISEGSGNYVVEGSYIKATAKKSRDRADCETAMPAWESEPDSKWEVRNITSKSIEIYLEADQDVPGQWIKLTKL